MSRQIRPLSRNTDSDIEVVEDSEPERVQLRHKSANDPGLLQRSISASRMHQRTLNSVGLHTTATVIEISDSESSNSSCGKNTIIYGLASGAVNSAKDLQQGSSKSTINIKNFAFKPLSTKQQAQPSVALPPRPLERSRAPKKVRMNLDSLLSDIARVSRCVCCSISWTTRKAATQKMEHIQRCAKKNGYDDETVRIMIKNEIASSVESNIGHGKVSTTHPTSTTLLEDVMQPRSNKRKIVYPNNHLIVGSPLREAILSRAKDIINGPSPDEASPQPTPGRKLVSELSPTVTFTASTLLQGSSKTSLFSATGQEGEYFPEPGQEALETMSTRTNQPTLNPTAIGIGKSLIRSHNSIGGGFERGSYHKDVDVQRDLLQVTPQKVPVRKVTKGTPKTSGKGVHRGTEIPLNEVTPPAKKAVSKMRSSTKKKIIFGKEWEMFMKERIREDNELNLRVIRYEPVDFNLFLKLAKAYAPSSSEGTLKSQLRHFLDNEAIHFYEGHVWGR